MKPLLAANANLDKIKFPVMVSPKLDGIRCLIRGGEALSRSLKPIPNRHVQDLAARWPEGADGELIVGCATDLDVYNRTQSAVMSREGKPDVHFVVFDRWDRPDEPFFSRVAFWAVSPRFGMNTLIPCTVNNTDELLQYEKGCLALGYEGVMIRDPNGRYKYGRSTVNEGILLKLKRFQDSEAVILGATELMHNSNESTTNELGYTERSHKKDGLVPMGTLGNLIVKDPDFGEFEIGTGFIRAQRKEIWDSLDTLKGCVVKYRFLPHGVKDKPRHPVFLGFRDVRDM